MKKINIVIKDENRQQIENLLKEVQKRAQVRTVTFEDIKKTSADEMQHFKENGVSHKNMAGCEATYCPSVFRSSSYSGAPQATFFTIKFTTRGATLVDVYRGYCNNLADARRIKLTEKARTAIMKHAVEHF